MSDFITRDELDAEVRAVRLQLQDARRRLEALDTMLSLLLRGQLHTLRASPDPADQALADEIVADAREQGVDL